MFPSMIARVIILVMLITAEFHSCQPIDLPSTFFEDIGPKNVFIPIHRQAFMNLRSPIAADNRVFSNRLKRNCLGYAIKQSFRSPKWMCW